ncbi:MAG: S-layer homology domain-containing protein [Smithellaceae bacterium]
MSRLSFRVITKALPAVFLLLAVSCAPTARIATSQLDTPQHHTFTGMKLLGHEKYTDAKREFELALQLDAKYSQAHSALALVQIHEENRDAALESLNKGWKFARTKEDRLLVHVNRIRVYTQSKDEKNRLAPAQSEFEAAIKLDANHAPAYYFMGLAYKVACDFNAAGEMFSKVLALKTDYTAEADVQWHFIQKVARAMPASATGKQIALVERLTRGDAAALLMEELKIDVLYKKRTPGTFDTSFKDPQQAAQEAVVEKPTAKDIGDHPLKADIEGILEVGVRGLEKYPDGNFHPADRVTRAAYAMMLEDILIKVTGDNALATRFIGSKSPFPDMRADLPYFNAVMVVTSRGIMEARDMTTGEFAPLGSVAGVDALLIIRKFKEELKFD